MQQSVAILKYLFHYPQRLERQPLRLPGFDLPVNRFYNSPDTPLPYRSESAMTRRTTRVTLVTLLVNLMLCLSATSGLAQGGDNSLWPGQAVRFEQLAGDTRKISVMRWFGNYR